MLVQSPKIHLKFGPKKAEISFIASRALVLGVDGKVVGHNASQNANYKIYLPTC